MLWQLLEDPKISALLSLILGVFLTYILSYRKLMIERKYHAADIEDERKKQEKVRYLTEFFKTYASFVVAIDELEICARTGKCDSKAIQNQVREGTLALTQIYQAAPTAIFNLANTCWSLVRLMVNNDMSYDRDFLYSALFAHLKDFNQLTKAHLNQEEVQLPILESAVFRLNADMDDFFKAVSKDDSSFMDWVDSFPASDETDQNAATHT